MSDRIDTFKSLHTALVDSRKGYEEALEDAEGKALTPLFRDMIALRLEHAAQLAALLQREGETVDDAGSFMAIVHRAVINIRSVITGLDESILPGLIDGEERILGYYDEALKEASAAETPLLTAQRDAVDRKVVGMKGMKHSAPA